MKSIQWTLAFSVFMVCGGFLPVTGAQTLVLPAGTGIAAVSPVVISTQTILAARERVTRVGWSETMIDTQQAAVPNGSIAWLAILKAALLGGEERMTAAIQAQVEELRALSQVTPLDSPSPSSESIPAASTISPFLSFEQNSRLLNANDVLKAIPEWTSVAADQKTQLHSLMQAVLAQPLLVLSEDSFTRLRQEVALWSRALIFDATQPADRDPQELLHTLQAAMIGEGLFSFYPLSQSLTATVEVLQMGAALQTIRPTLYSEFKPLMEKLVSTTAQLVYPNGVFPAAFSEIPIEPRLIAELLERGGKVTGNPLCKRILTQIYKNQPRLPEALLYGELALDEGPKGELPSTALPQIGGVFLHSPTETWPLTIRVDTGMSSWFGQSALLSLDVLAPGEQVTGLAGIEAVMPWNTVILDEKRQPTVEPMQPRNALLYAMRTAKNGTTYASLMAQGEYTERKAYPDTVLSDPSSVYQRDLYFSAPLLFDSFRVSGGQQHDYQYTHSGTVQNVSGIAGDPTGGPVNSQGVYAVTFAPKENQTFGERLWLIDPAGSQLRLRQQDRGTTVLLSRSVDAGEADLFAVVHEFFQGEAPTTTNVLRLPLAPGGNQREFQAIALAAETALGTEIFLTSTNPETEYTCDYQGNRLVFQGTWGHIQLQDGAFHSMRLGGGTRLRYGSHGIEPQEIMINGLLREFDEAENQLTMEFSSPLPEAHGSRGHSILAISQNPAPVMFQSFLLDTLSLFESPQTATLLHTPALAQPHPGIGFALQPGTPLVYESFTELYREDEFTYIMGLNTPTQFMIPGDVKAPKLRYRLPNGRFQITGELKFGTIQLRLTPDDMARGEIMVEKIGPGFVPRREIDSVRDLMRRD